MNWNNILNEMARQTVNRTIDKKLWLTVSSIISRNRTSEAENIKPINNDKDNLLQRYVAALLIMKKPCPTTIEDIGKLKTFKNIGYKFIDLGGTIQDIQKLYNENNSNVPSTTSDNNISTILKSDEHINIESPKKQSSFWDELDDEPEDNNEDDSFFGDILSDINNKPTMLDKMSYILDNKSSIEKVFRHLTNSNTNPKGFKLFKPKNYNEYQQLIYTSNTNQATSGYKLYEKCIENGWTQYINPLCKLIYAPLNYLIKQSLISINGGYNHTYYLKYKYFPLQIKKHEDIEKSINSVLGLYYNVPKEYLKYKTKYLDFQNMMGTFNIDNKFVEKLFNDSYNLSVLISPDKGLYLLQRIKIRKVEQKSTGWYDSYNMLLDDTIRIVISFEYIISFTGKENYYDILHNDNISVLQQHNEKQEKTNIAILSIIRSIIKENMHALADMFISSYNFIELIHENDIWGIKGRCWKTDSLYNYMWRKKDSLTTIKSDKNPNYPNSKYMANTNITDPGILAEIYNPNNTVCVYQFNQPVNGRGTTVCAYLLPEGLKIFKEKCKLKNIQI